jgi:hypothetical protein
MQTNGKTVGEVKWPVIITHDDPLLRRFLNVPLVSSCSRYLAMNKIKQVRAFKEVHNLVLTTSNMD